MTNDQYIEITDLHEDKYDELIQTLVNPTINEIKSDIGFLTRIIKNLENQIKFTKENM